VEVGIRSVSNGKDDTWKDVAWYGRKKSFPAEVCAKLDSVSTPAVAFSRQLSRYRIIACLAVDCAASVEQRCVKAAKSAQPHATATISAFRVYVK
jgi:hypothetical protein